MHKLLMALMMGFGVVGAPLASAQMSSGTPELLAKHLVDVGGERRMNLVCMGHGSPTLVFEYAFGGHMLTWQKIQVPASKVTRACFYDRAGYGFSDPSPRPMTAIAVTDDLHTLLHRAGVTGPVVLVAHSLGGLYATLYADRFLSEVAGMVLIDPSAANMHPSPLSAEEKAGSEAEKTKYRKCADLERAGTLSPSNPHDCIPPMRAGRTPTEIAYLMKILLGPSFYESVLSEDENITPSESGPDEDSLEEDRAKRSFGAMPMIVLTHATKEPSPEAEPWLPAMSALHDQLAARSSRGEHRLVYGSGHYIQVDQPDAVVDAIRKVVAEVREDHRSH
jgi:pimeloyl-ACP methyl ester carboxylesterase